MKTFNKYILAVGVLVASASFVLAQNTSPSRLSQSLQEIQQIRSQAQDQIRQIRTEMMTKIDAIKDQVKRTAADRIVARLDHVNQVWTDHFTNVLDKLEDILKKVQSRADKAQANGQDVSAVNIAVQNAESKIVAARSAVADQAKKTYIVDPTKLPGATSSTTSQNSLISKLRDQFKLLRDQLLKDLTTLRDGAMKDARNSVQDAASALSQVPDVDLEPNQNK